MTWVEIRLVRRSLEALSSDLETQGLRSHDNYARSMPLRLSHGRPTSDNSQIYLHAIREIRRVPNRGPRPGKAAGRRPSHPGIGPKAINPFIRITGYHLDLTHFCAIVHTDSRPRKSRRRGQGEEPGGR